jgi:hypothetical protein
MSEAVKRQAEATTTTTTASIGDREGGHQMYSPRGRCRDEIGGSEIASRGREARSTDVQ